MGFPFATFFHVVAGLAPVVVPLLPGGAALAPFIPVLVQGITEMQQDSTTANADKRAAVVSRVVEAGTAQGADPTVLAAAAGVAVDTLVSQTNAVRDAHAALPVTSPALAPSLPTALGGGPTVP